LVASIVPSAFPREPVGKKADRIGRRYLMPRGEWTPKQERKYEHIKRSQKQRGAGERRAKEIAARTIQKERARTGQARTRSRTSVQDISSSRRGGQRSGTRGPRGRTREQLYNEARQLGIKGRSTMNKAQLQRAVSRKKAS
jgi:hypothetical protein